MDLWLFIPGIILLIILSIDILTTILQMEGGGVVSNSFARGLWRLFQLAAGRNGRAPILRYAGLCIICALLLSWVFVLWLSFSLMFLSDQSSVLITSNDHIAEPLRKVYFIGYTITSLGNGDVKAGSDFWRITTNLMGISGTIFITLSISYLVPVLQAASQKRALAAYIHQMGVSPQAMIQRAWNGKDCSRYHSYLQQLQMQILQHSEQHQAYPILHYFHATDPQYNIVLNLVKLDEAISIQQVYQLDSEEGQIYWTDVRKAVDRYLSKINRAQRNKSEHSPPLNYEDKLQHILHTKADQKADDWQKLSDRRKLLLSLIKDDGWDWNEVVHPETEDR